LAELVEAEAPRLLRLRYEQISSLSRSSRTLRGLNGSYVVYKEKQGSRVVELQSGSFDKINLQTKASDIFFNMSDAFALLVVSDGDKRPLYEQLLAING